MISTEIVESITADGRIVTNKGVRRAAGNALVRVGSSVTVMGDMVLGWRRRTGYVPGAPVPAFGYKFASGTTMYYTDLELNLLREESITPPAENAQLMAHAYDAGTEYFVWLDNENSPYRCIIERNGVIIADVGTEIPSMPDECDARITNGAIEWVVGCRFPDEPRWYLARFENETLKESVTFDLSQYFESATTESSDRLVEQISHAEYSAVPGDASVETMQIYLARGGRTGLMQLVEYTGSEIVL